MLTELRIKNFAIIEALTLPLAPGFNVLSGETGAIGKAAHAFKSAAGSIQARGLAVGLQALELAGRAGAMDTLEAEDAATGV